jgi:glyoxylase-like metal-dependent hydrolase (beta-lactamase superfamily II)
MIRAVLHPVSGGSGKGPACFLVETGGARIVLDLGYGPQPGLWPDVSQVGRVDALLLSHGHRDHAGGLNLLPEIGNPPIYATDIVRRMLPREVTTHPLPLNGTADVCGVTVTTGRNGHAPGGIWLHLATGAGLLYMGDYSLESIVYAADPPPRATTLILDASYGDYDTPLSEQARALDALIDSRPVLLPVPECGHGPEIALHIARSGRPLPHIDDALRAALIRLAGAQRACLRPGVAETLGPLATSAPRIEGRRGARLASRADATAGEAARLAELWEVEAEPAIVFTAYLTPGTPAMNLTQRGRARYLRWNVHPRLTENIALARAVGAHTIVPAFGEAKHLPMWQQAFAPAQVAIAERVPL